MGVLSDHRYVQLVVISENTGGSTSVFKYAISNHDFILFCEKDHYFPSPD